LVPKKGQRAIGEIPLVAHLKLSHEGLSSANHVARAYWLLATNYEIGLDIGQTQTVVAGSHEGPLFASYNCNYQFDGVNAFNVPHRELGERSVLPATGTISIELSLIDPHTRTTIESFTHQIMFKPAAPTVDRRI
jgi:hypothetical protein